MSATYQVKKADADQYLTFDLASGEVWFAPASLAYSFERGVADVLAAQHGGVVGTLTTVYSPSWKASRTWSPA